MLEQLFGGEMSVAVRFVIAFGVVLSLIVLTFVGLRRFAGRRLPLSNAGRARQPRLGVLDAFAIDARRRLVLIRRDNVEHLIMIGGPNDVLVESEIVRAPAQAAIAPQRAQRTPGENTRAAVAAPERGVARALPPPEPMQAQAHVQQQMPEAPPVTPAAFRNAFPPRPAARPAAPAPAASAPPPPPPRAPIRAPQRQPEMMVEPEEQVAAPVARPKAEIDPLYADIERKLGEALSRPASSPPTPPAPTRMAPPPSRAAPPPLPPRASAPPPPPPPAARRAPEPPAPRAASKNHLDELEEEMASLLGRDRAT